MRGYPEFDVQLRPAMSANGQYPIPVSSLEPSKTKVLMGEKPSATPDAQAKRLTWDRSIITVPTTSEATDTAATSPFHSGLAGKSRGRCHPGAFMTSQRYPYYSYPSECPLSGCHDSIRRKE